MQCMESSGWFVHTYHPDALVLQFFRWQPCGVVLFSSTRKNVEDALLAREGQHLLVVCLAVC